MTTTPTALRDAGTHLAESAADMRVLALIDAAVERACATGQPFTVDDIRDELPTCGPKVVGARFLTLSKRRPRLMVPVGFKPSGLATTRAACVRVWIGVKA